MLSLRNEITVEYRDAIWILFAGVAAGLISLAFAWLTIQIGSHYYPPHFAFQRYEILEGRVLLFTVGVSMICGLCFSGAKAALAGHPTYASLCSQSRSASPPCSRSIP